MLEVVRRVVVLSNRMAWKKRTLASFLRGFLMMQLSEQVGVEMMELVGVVVVERLLLAASFPRL